MHTINPLPEGGYQIDIDGPYSLFSAVTKYGVKLALLHSALDCLDNWDLTADVLWGKERKPAVFKTSILVKGRQLDLETVTRRLLPEHIQTFIDRFRSTPSRWRIEAANEILEVKGLGLCIPDFSLINNDTGEVVFLEIMGFWSRDASWNRVDLVNAGLSQRVIFAVSKRLRVSPEVLGTGRPGSLYVYKGVMQPQKVIELLEANVEFPR